MQYRQPAHNWEPRSAPYVFFSSPTTYHHHPISAPSSRSWLAVVGVGVGGGEPSSGHVFVRVQGHVRARACVWCGVCVLRLRVRAPPVQWPSGRLLSTVVVVTLLSDGTWFMSLVHLSRNFDHTRDLSQPRETCIICGLVASSAASLDSLWESLVVNHGITVSAGNLTTGHRPLTNNVT
ncbi:hypothetical protein BC827DRAFT_818760 [Russula dissimulans]|nr:hypothetical protein BC827DRAFT_818760 [Russula dissimulans]